MPFLLACATTTKREHAEFLLTEYSCLMTQVCFHVRARFLDLSGRRRSAPWRCSVRCWPFPTLVYCVLRCESVPPGVSVSPIAVTVNSWAKVRSGPIHQNNARVDDHTMALESARISQRFWVLLRRYADKESYVNSPRIQTPPVRPRSAIEICS